MYQKYTHILGFIFILIFSVSVSAQTKEINGTVKDQTGASIAGASVVLRNNATGLERTVTTNSDGEFSFNNLGAGNFELIVTADGFQREIVKADSSNIQIQLQIATVTAETTVFSGSRQDELRESLNTKVEVVTRTEIRDTGYETVGEVLKEIPGIITRRGSDTGTSSGAAGEQIQGIGSRQSLVLLDGFPVIGARGIKSGTINLDRQSTARIEQIEVVKGAASALYGSDAIGGVVNLITRDSKRPLEGTISVSGGNFGIFDPRADLGFKKNKFSGFLSVERYKNNGFDLTPTTFDTTGAGFHTYNLFNKLRYDFTPKFYISTLADVRTGNYKSRSLGERGFQSEDTDEKAQSYGLTANWNFTSRGLAQFRGYFSRFDEITEQRLINGTRVPDENLFERFGLVDGTVSYVWGERQLIQFGGEWRTNRYRGINRLRNDTGERADTRVLWGQDKISLNNRLTLTVGLRFDDHSIFGSAYSPKIGLNFRVHDRINLRASWGRGFRAPDLGQLYYRFFNPTNLYQVIGNPNLRPEHSGSWQVGAEYASRLKHYRFSVNFFRNDVVNLIEAKNYGFVVSTAQVNAIFASLGLNPAEFRPSLNRLLFIYTNLSNVFTQGAEFDGDIKLPKGFALSGAYTYLDARDKTTGAYLSERTKHQGLIKLAYDNPEIGFRGNIRTSYFSGYKTSSLTNRGIRQDVTLGDYETVDVYAAKSLTNGFEVFGTVENLFNVKDRNVGRFDAVTNEPLPIYRPDAGRMFRLGIRYSFSREK
jgi:outer membrane receptor for ferrienterochelin and colicins